MGLIATALELESELIATAVITLNGSGVKVDKLQIKLVQYVSTIPEDILQIHLIGAHPMCLPVFGFTMIRASTHPSKAFMRLLSVVKEERLPTNNLVEGSPAPLVTKSSAARKQYNKARL